MKEDYELMIIVMQSDTLAAKNERVSSKLRHWEMIPKKPVYQQKVMIDLVSNTSKIDLKQNQSA